MLHDVAPEDVGLFWPGDNPNQCAADHLRFIEKYWGFPVKKVYDMHCLGPLLFEPTNLLGFKLWIRSW
jgi:hypothetical protein